MVDDMAVIGGVMTQDEERTTITARDLKVVSALQCNGRMTLSLIHISCLFVGGCDDWRCQLRC